MSYFSTTIFNMSKDGPRDTEIPKISVHIVLTKNKKQTKNKH